MRVTVGVRKGFGDLIVRVGAKINHDDGDVVDEPPLLERSVTGRVSRLAGRHLAQVAHERLCVACVPEAVGGDDEPEKHEVQIRQSLSSWPHIHKGVRQALGE